MKAICKAILTAFVAAFLFGCAGTQPASATTTDRWGNPCPQWQSYASCRNNH